MTPPPCRIALAGYARTGKDTVGAILVAEYAMRSVAMGNLIKYQLDPLIREQLGFSAFTQNDVEKKQIREVLVHWGYANCDRIEDAFFNNLPARCVNTRIFRVRECRRWVRAGGAIWEVTRPGFFPAEPREEIELQAAKEAGLVSLVIRNDGTLPELRAQIREAMATMGES